MTSPDNEKIPESSGESNSEQVKVAHPEMIKKTRFSKIWLLPILALIIGLWMLYQDWQNQGIPIQITFATAEGLVAGKTLLKNRNVDIGIATHVGFTKDKGSILVELEVDQEMRSFLQTDSQFWVVRPRVGIEGISGVSTLLTGAYIQVAPGESGVFDDKFDGLNQPPVTPANVKGLRLQLISAGGRQLRIGDPIIHNGFDVGRVETFEFDPKRRQASYGIFVQAPYDALVTENTFFWNMSGINFSTSTEGIKLDVASLDTFIRGGVEFDVLEDTERGLPITQSRTFQLFDSKQSIAQQRAYDYLEYVMLVEDSVAGLHKGAAVEYRGIRIGTVETPFLGFDEITKITGAQYEERIPVVIRVEPERLSESYSDSLAEFQALFDGWVKDGLTGYIETASLITGSLKITLSPGGESLETLAQFGEYSVIPTGKGTFANISNKVEAVLDKVDQLPVEEILEKIDKLKIEELLASMNQTVQTADSVLVALENTLEELDETLNGLEPDSSLHRSITETMETLQTTLDSISPLVQEISNKPNSLVFGGNKSPDVEPKASVAP